LLTNVLALAMLVSTMALLNARWEYRKRGKHRALSFDS
jgi:hypothetical protein